MPARIEAFIYGSAPNVSTPLAPWTRENADVAALITEYAKAHYPLCSTITLTLRVVDGIAEPQDWVGAS